MSATRHTETASLKRYDVRDERDPFGPGMGEHVEGDYVRYEDYAHLRRQLALVTKLARIYYDDRHPAEHAVLNYAEALSDEQQVQK